VSLHILESFRILGLRARRERETGEDREKEGAVVDDGGARDA